MTDNNELKYLVALSFIKDIGPVTTRRLLSVFHTPENIFRASDPELRGAGNVKESKTTAIKEFASWDRVEREIEAAKKHGFRIIKFSDREYPEPLKQIESAPLLLYVKGDLIEEDRYAIAMVGSRRMTEYGRNVAESIAFNLASCGLTIVSGMARGIDTVSHKGALKAGGRSIAVLGCGLDTPYPSENTGLYEEIAGSGCVISEFPLGTPPNRENFPRRNRLISGLSLGVLVVEAANNSGSLITANYALEQGRDVFAVPGIITSKHFEGTNTLIKKGAKLVQKSEDILEELSPLLKGLLQCSKSGVPCNSIAKRPAWKAEGLEINDEEKALCIFLGEETKHIDVISRESKIAPAKLLGLLLGLEIKGLVRQADGKRFYIV